MQTSALRYVTLILILSVIFFIFDVASDVYERIVANSAPSLLDLTHLFFEVFSAGALILAIRILVRQLRWLEECNTQQWEISEFPARRDGQLHARQVRWLQSDTSAERDIAMYMLKGLSIAEIAAARSTAEGTVRHRPRTSSARPALRLAWN